MASDLSREPAPIGLVRNPDILASLVAARAAGQIPLRTVLVGFAAETGDASGDPLTHARAKLATKGADMLVLNDVGGGRVFGEPDNSVHILTAGIGAVLGPFAGSKEDLSHDVWDQVHKWRSSIT